jgi:hypothetical protein
MKVGNFRIKCNQVTGDIMECTVRNKLRKRKTHLLFRETSEITGVQAEVLRGKSKKIGK